MTNQTINTMQDVPYLPGGADDLNRRKQSAKRLRIMTGTWLPDLDAHMSEHFVDVRREQMGKPDLSTNLMLNVIQQLSALYSTKPEVINDENMTSNEAEFLEEVDESGLWSMATDNQGGTLAMREGFINPTVTSNGLLYRQVTPNNVYAEASADNPDLPNYLIEARTREYEGKRVWTWDVYDIKNSDNPSFKVLLPQEDRDPIDITDTYFEAEMSGSDYPWRYTQGDRAGTPFIPYAMYHAQRTGKLWDPYRHVEVVEGTLTVAVLWSFWLHNVKDSSWAQKYAIDIRLQGTGNQGSPGQERQVVQTDSSSILMFSSKNNDGSGSLGQFDPAIDPDTLGKALREYEERLAVYFGIAPDDFKRNGSAESGYAISIKRDAVREAQKRFEQQFRRGDIDLIEKSAAIYNIYNSASVSETGWNIIYTGLPFTSVEVDAALVAIEKKITLGLASKVDAIILLNPGLSREAAMLRLNEIRRENAILTTPII